MNYYTIIVHTYQVICKGIIIKITSNPNKEQIKILNHQMYIYNQAYNICLNLWQKENSKNKDLPKELKT